MILKRKRISEKVSTLKIDFLKGTGEVKHLKKDGFFFFFLIVSFAKQRRK